MKLWCQVLCGAAALSYFSGAWAAPFSQIIAFGDSLTDSGQFPDAGGPMVLVDGQPLPTHGRRFTNRVGPTYLPGAGEPTAAVAIERVSARLGLGPLHPAAPALPQQLTGKAPGTNYAWAGAETPEILASIAEPGGATTAVPEMNLVTPRDGYLVESPEADAAALFYLNGGANDIFATVQNFLADAQTAATNGSALPSIDDAVMQTAAANLAEGVDALHAAGARYIMVANVPNLSRTPFLAAVDAQVAAVMPQMADAIAGHYGEAAGQLNRALYEALRETGANVIPLNIDGLLAEIAETPEWFGFGAPDVLTTCFDASEGDCRENPAVGLNSTTPNPDQLLYADLVHPTARGQEIIANYQAQMLTAPGEFALLGAVTARAARALTEEQLYPARQFAGGDAMRYQLGLLAGARRWTEKNTLFENLEADAELEQMVLQASLKLNNTIAITAAAAIAKGALDFNGSASSAQTEGYSAAVGSRLHQGRWRAQLALAVADQDIEFNRSTNLGAYRDRVQLSDTHASTIAITTRLQLDLSQRGAAWQFGPFARAWAARTKLGAFNETGPAASSLRVSQIKQWAYIGEAGAFVEASNAKGALAGTIGYRHHFNDGKQDVQMRQLALPETAPYLLPAIADTDWGGITGAASARLYLSAATNLSVRYEAGYFDDIEQQLFVAFAYAF